MSVIVCYNSRTLYTYTTSRHVCGCLLQQSYTVYIYYKPSCLWLFVTTIVFYTYPELLLVHTRTNVVGSFPTTWRGAHTRQNIIHLFSLYEMNTKVCQYERSCGLNAVEIETFKCKNEDHWGPIGRNRSSCLNARHVVVK